MGKGYDITAISKERQNQNQRFGEVYVSMNDRTNTRRGLL